MLHHQGTSFISRFVLRIVYSLTPNLYVSESVVTKTLFLLRQFQDSTGNPSEGLIYWAGVKFKDCFVVTTAVLPQCESAANYVKTSPLENIAVMDRLRKFNLKFIAQIHTHPGENTKIDDEDAFYSWKPTRKFFYIIVPVYGRDKDCFPYRCSFYFFMSNRFYTLTDDWIENNLQIVPSSLDSKHHT